MEQFFIKRFFFSCLILSWYAFKIMMEIFEAYKTVLIWLSGLSLLFFLVSLAAVPWLVVRIPETYFRDLALNSRSDKASAGSNLGRFAVRGAKTCLGLVLVFVGGVMLFVPGQGLLTILAGMVLMEFPGKRKLVIFLVGHQGVQIGLNWVRRRNKVAPLVFPGPWKG